MDLTIDILLSNGFLYHEDSILAQMSKEDGGQYFEFEKVIKPEDENAIYQYFFITARYGLSNSLNRDWSIHIDNGVRETVGSVDIQTVEHFNQLMDLLDINFHLK